MANSADPHARRSVVIDRLLPVEADSERDVRRGQLAQVMALLAVLAVVGLGVQMIASGHFMTWFAMACVALTTSFATFMLGRRQATDAAGWVLVAGTCLTLVAGVFVSNDLATWPFWLAPIAAAGMLIMRDRRSSALVLIVTLVSLLVLARMSSPLTFDRPNYVDLLVNGGLVSAITALVVLYGVWDRTRGLTSTAVLRAEAEALLAQVEADKESLEVEVARRERDLRDVLEQRQRYVTELSLLVVRDHRTGLFNRRHLDEAWPAIVEASDRIGRPISVAALDLDHFGRINTSYSHQIGDGVLAEFASLQQGVTRVGDLCYRLGQGEEFVIVMPYAGATAATAVAQRVASECRNRVWASLPSTERLTVSIGAAERVPNSGESWESVLNRADQAMLAAKVSGRDRVVSALGPLAQSDDVG